jgi:alpha/beta superfamily hydrolase
MKRNILFVHGFGVMKDARGMFTEIVNQLPKDYNCILVDLNNKVENTILLNPFSKQIEILRIAKQQHFESETIDLICHSQGCTVAALANLPNIRKTIFLAPAVESNNEKTIAYFSKNPETKININGTSLLARRDGTFTSVPSEFWKEKELIDLVKLYENYTKTHDTIVIKALNDEVVSADVTVYFKTSKIIELEADHDFRNESREALIATLKDLLN